LEQRLVQARIALVPDFLRDLAAISVSVRVGTLIASARSLHPRCDFISMARYDDLVQAATPT
jgi:hypothetical protein